MIEAPYTEEDLVLPLLRSSVIPARFHHGFTTRRGGVSAPPFDTLNLGMKWGDARDNVMENRRRLRRAAGSEDIYVASQVHAATVIAVTSGDAVADVAKAQADALCSIVPGVVLGAFVADCIPLLMADVVTGAVAAVHAGWRGTVARVVTAAVGRMAAEYGTRPEDLRVAMGPAIGPCCFEVGDEVVAAVEASIPDARDEGVIREQAANDLTKRHVDLKRANAVLLMRAGVPRAFIDAGPECTSCDAKRFFSYRRDAGVTGQMIGFIATAGRWPAAMAVTAA
jgi:YfiH family protein